MNSSTSHDALPLHRRPGFGAQVGAGLTLTISGASYFFLHRITPELPAQIPVHWGLSGPDRFTDHAGFEREMLWLMCLPVITMAVVGLASWWEARRTRHPVDFRLAVCTGVLMSLMMGVNTSWTYHSMRGVIDGHTVGDMSLIGLFAGFVVGAAAAAAFWKVLPVTVVEQPASVGRRVQLAPHERAVWVRTISSPVWLQVVLWATAVWVGAAPWFGQRPPTGVVLLLTAVAVLSGVLALAFTRFRVVVDERGLSWRSTVGLCGGRTSLEHIASARYINDVNPVEHGGWGFRVIPGGSGLILRRGEGLQITKTKGTTFTVTVDDAETGAALLNSLLDRKEQ